MVYKSIKLTFLDPAEPARDRVQLLLYLKRLLQISFEDRIMRSRPDETMVRFDIRLLWTASLGQMALAYDVRTVVSTVDFLPHKALDMGRWP